MSRLVRLLKMGWTTLNFKKKYSKVTVLAAMIHGVIIGIAAVAIVGFIIVGTSSKSKQQAADNEVVTKPVEKPGETTPTSGPDAAIGAEPPLKLFAKQHGVFSSAESAAVFIAEDPGLSKASVIESQGQFYVWSAVGLDGSEFEVSEAEGTFRKPFNADTSACSAAGAGKLRKTLTETALSQIKTLTVEGAGDSEDAKAAEFRKHIIAVTAFTSDLTIVRLKLLSHYTNKDGCVKIGF